MGGGCSRACQWQLLPVGGGGVAESVSDTASGGRGVAELVSGNYC